MDNEPESERKLRQQRRWDRAILISVFAIIGSGILTLATQDPFVSRSSGSATTSCVANLRCIDGAKATWALENTKPNTAMPTDAELYGATNYIREKPRCPKGGTYITGRVDRKPRCTFPGHTL